MTCLAEAAAIHPNLDPPSPVALNRWGYLPLLSKTLREDRGAWCFRPGNLQERMRTGLNLLVETFIAT